MPALKDVYLYATGMGDVGLSALISSGCAELRTVMLHCNQITDEGLQASSPTRNFFHLPVHLFLTRERTHSSAQALSKAIVRNTFYSKCIKVSRPCSRLFELVGLTAFRPCAVWLKMRSMCLHFRDPLDLRSQLHSNKTSLSAEVDFLIDCRTKWLDLDLSEALKIAKKQLYH